MSTDYKGTIVKESLTDPAILDELQIVSERVAGDWHLYTVMISEADITRIQACLKWEGGWYTHFWHGDDVVVVFRDKLFHIKYSDQSTWQEAIAYGLSVGVPREQLDFLIENEE